MGLSHGGEAAMVVAGVLCVGVSACTRRSTTLGPPRAVCSVTAPAKMIVTVSSKPAADEWLYALGFSKLRLSTNDMDSLLELGKVRLVLSPTDALEICVADATVVRERGNLSYLLMRSQPSDADTMHQWLGANAAIMSSKWSIAADQWLAQMRDGNRTRSDWTVFDGEINGLRATIGIDASDGLCQLVVYLFPPECPSPPWVRPAPRPPA